MIIEQASMTLLPTGSTVLTIVVQGDRSAISEQVALAMRDPQKEPYELVLKRIRKGRSLDANAYAWVLIDKIAAKLGLKRTEVYKEAIKDVPGVSTLVCTKNEAVDSLVRSWERNGIGWQAECMPSKLEGCTNVILYYGSSAYDSKQMSALIDQLVEECKELKLETMPPDVIARMEGLI